MLKVTACAYRPWIRDARIVPYGSTITTATGYSFPSGHTMNAATLYGGSALRKDMPRTLRITLALLGDAIRDKHRELLRREFYDEYGDYYDDPVEKFEAMRAHVDQHEGDSIISCFLHVLRYGKRTYVDPVLENPMVQNAISQAVSLRVQRKLSEGVSRNESTNADEANITRQGCTDNHGLSSSKDAISPNVQKPDVQEPTTTGAKAPSSQLTLDTINKESFMKEAGYSTHVPTEERHRILDDLRAEYTEKEIEDRLNFNVNLKKNSSKDYSNAIEVWQKDLDYLHSGDTED